MHVPITCYTCIRYVLAPCCYGFIAKALDSYRLDYKSESWDTRPSGNVFVEHKNVLGLKVRGDEGLATKQELIGLFEHLEAELDKAGFFKPGSGTTVYTPNIDASMVIVSASIAVADADAAPGDGGLLQLRAKLRGTATKTQVQITHVVAIDPANRRVPVQGSLPLDIAVEP